MIKKYRKRFVAEALQLTANNLQECLEFVGSARLILLTSAGNNFSLCLGDYILKDEYGQFTTCEAARFHEVFEEEVPAARLLTGRVTCP